MRREWRTRSVPVQDLRSALVRDHSRLRDYELLRAGLVTVCVRSYGVGENIKIF